MPRRKGWKDCYEYKRVLEILREYWANERDEDFVAVYMRFVHKDGKTQEKTIVWRNPNSGEASA